MGTRRPVEVKAIVDPGVGDRQLVVGPPLLVVRLDERRVLGEELDVIGHDAPPPERSHDRFPAAPFVGALEIAVGSVAEAEATLTLPRREAKRLSRTDLLAIVRAFAGLPEEWHLVIAGATPGREAILGEQTWVATTLALGTLLLAAALARGRLARTVLDRGPLAYVDLTPTFSCAPSRARYPMLGRAPYGRRDP